ncbi:MULTISPECIES: pyrroline-5-carboxylate reductase family protein [unclassified Archaeoglobus]|jgi:pyrroline-5-carboxylate reductase|uniref:pyrroline-5-carboxylate reductase family protein n=1 Tax=unclassified Archaeoglobus TaxID=2643606 RepID=UPI0025BD1B03|nr:MULTISPECIES: pyrroline-5-carboxylate reductase dimerization domain-containing protein [unclassified Archaeoglobus]
MRVGVIGAGNLGMALAKNASKRAEVVAVKRKVVEMEGIEVTDRMEGVRDCDVILVALKPDVFRRELERIGRVAEERPVVSFAAGVKLDEMRRHIKNPFRAMTNIAISLVAYWPAETFQHISFLDTEFIECSNESELDVMTAYLGSSPSILAYLLHAFILSAIRDGVNYTKSLKVAVSSFKATAELYERLGLEGMLRKIATPAGTTIEGVIRVGEAQRALIEALSAASSKARVI